jgi:hypothetical protein
MSEGEPHATQSDRTPTETHRLGSKPNPKARTADHAANGQAVSAWDWTALNWHGRAEPEQQPRGLPPPPTRRNEDDE